jgi:hypothetical protein
MNDKIADDRFSKKITNKERAAFELGIKLGALFHIAIGIPIARQKETVDSIERALENSILCQPFVSSVKIKILNTDNLGNKEHPFDYSGINPRNLSADVIVEYKDVKIKGKLEWNNELNYPLMVIDDIS